MGQDMYSKHAETPTALSAHTSTGAAGVRWLPWCNSALAYGPKMVEARSSTFFFGVVVRFCRGTSTSDDNQVVYLPVTQITSSSSAGGGGGGGDIIPGNRIRYNEQRNS